MSIEEMAMEASCKACGTDAWDHKDILELELSNRHRAKVNEQV
jgi:hypothetical protein